MYLKENKKEGLRVLFLTGHTTIEVSYIAFQFLLINLPSLQKKKKKISKKILIPEVS